MKWITSFSSRPEKSSTEISQRQFSPYVIFRAAASRSSLDSLQILNFTFLQDAAGRFVQALLWRKRRWNHPEHHHAAARNSSGHQTVVKTNISENTEK
jgi:hypothetical protein